MFYYWVSGKAGSAYRHEREPQLPGRIRQWYGYSRGHWGGQTLVVDVDENFIPKTVSGGARGELALVERWTRTGRPRSKRRDHEVIRRCGRVPGP